MSEFRYRALDASGHPHLGTVTANTWDEAREIVAEEGYQQIEPGGDNDRTWARRQELRYLIRHLDTSKILVLVGILLGLAGLGVGLRWASHKTLKVQGIYSAPTPKRKPRRRLQMSFFVDGREVEIQPKSVKVTKNSYQATLSFYQWSAPAYLVVQLRMRGHRPASNRPIPLRNHKPDQVLNLPALTLRPLNPPGKKGPSAPRRTNPKEWLPQ